VNLLQELQRDLMSQDVRPDWNPSGPVCTERCPSHDGKRCEQQGFPPSHHCDVAVKEMAEMLRRFS
jgi:hypothetical protein